MKKTTLKKIIEILFHIIIYQNVEIKDFNVLIDGKSYFNLPVKDQGEAYEQIIEMSTKNDYTNGNLLDLDFFFLINLKTLIPAPNLIINNKTRSLNIFAQC